MLCHLILLSPLIGFGLFIFFPFWTAFPLYIVILVISGTLYFKIVEDMRIPAKMGWEEMIGSEAIVVSDINPKGIIRYKNELWSAISNETLKKGERVKINGLDRMNVVVERLSE